MFKNDLYEALLFHSRLQGYVNKISIGFSNEKAFVDTMTLENTFRSAIAARPREGIIDLIEFIGTADPNWLSRLNWNAHDFLLAELNKSPELGAISFDLTNLSVRIAAATENSLAGSFRPDLLVGTLGSDTLLGADGNDILQGKAGNDSLDGGSGDDLLDGGVGNDLISDDSGLNSLRGGAGNDSIRGRGSFAGGSGDDVLQASDPYFGDSYHFQIGDGKDAINDLGYGGMDTIIFGGGINANMLWFQKSGADLEVTRIGSTEGVSIKNWYTSGHQQIERFRSDDGKVLLNTNVDALVRAMATFSPPSLGQTTLSGNYLSALNTVITANWL